MIYRILLLVYFLAGLVACKSGDQDSKLYPSDYLFMQRSYPSGKIDHEAYKSSLAIKEQMRLRSSFAQSWEKEGPFNISGRVTDIEMHASSLDEVYAGSASGGILKSNDQGLTWQQVFSDQATQSIGDLDIASSNPQVIYAGTGEANAGGGSVAYDGLGVFKSNDAGQSWEHIGLENVGSIGRVLIHPSDPNHVFVAAMGSLFENNPERGLFRTMDGGQSWEHILYVSDSTGGIDLVMHPINNNVLYAAMWERIRRPNYRQYGGHTSGVYKSEDGGENWIELGGGLPQDSLSKGRIGLAISESHPNIICAYYANTNGTLGGLYLSEDGGMSWESKPLVNVNNVPFMWWFGQVEIHPENPDTIYITGLNMHRSSDGGNTWERIFDGAHVDHHSFYQHPTNPLLAFNANDGGINKSIDGGAQHFNENGLNNIQFYTCEIDPVDPTIIYGGAQDNGTLRSRGNPSDWEHIFGGDGFRVLVDPIDNNQIYVEAQNGNIFASLNGGNIYYPAQTGLEGSFNWNTPIAMDPNNSSTLYTGSQALFKSNDKAMNWEKISPDLLQIDVNGNIVFGSFTSIDVSSFDSNIIIAGADNGGLFLTTDGGFTFEDISEDLPDRWVTSVAHDPWNESGLYVTLSGFRFGEHASQVYYSDDLGHSWRSIGASLPDIPVNDIIVDHLVLNQLYLATDIGVFSSEDLGESWQLLGTGVPAVPILDIDYHGPSRKLLIATYGHGMMSYELAEITSVNDDPFSSINIFPNPTTDQIQITGSKNMKMELLDINGSLLEKVKTRELNLSKYGNGVYFLRFREDDRQVIRKIICL